MTPGSPALPETGDVLVVGGGPAGLRAAEIVSAAGRKVILADRMPSVGRKFLVAGKGGLNLTHSEPVENFPARYGGSVGGWQKLLAECSPGDLRAWAEGLGVETFVGTSGRVFPTTKQAAPLLRRWLARLRGQGVAFRLRHELTGLGRAPSGLWQAEFSTPAGTASLAARAVILALGGGSWPQTGSTGAWRQWLGRLGIAIAPFAPANCGYETEWPAAFLAKAEGLPLKNIVLRAGGLTVAGELLVTRHGLEGGALYLAGRALRAMAQPEVVLDLKPMFTTAQLLGKGASGPPTAARAAKAWRLGPAAAALLALREPFASWDDLAAAAKQYRIALRGPRPLEEAISTAGGIAAPALDDHLMLRALPGVFAAGEMLDWDAPTGGYLLQGCFATAARAAQGARQWLDSGRLDKLPADG